MIRFINHMTGSVMWVHETRVAEYLAAGDRPLDELPAQDPVPPPPPQAETAPAKPEKTAARSGNRSPAKKNKKTTSEEW